MAEMDLHHKLYRRCVRRCCEHEVVAELGWTDLNLLDVFTSKKKRFPWQKKHLERQPVTFSEVLDSSVDSETLRKLEDLKHVDEKTLFGTYTDRLEVNHKGHLTASAKTYAHVNIEDDKMYQVNVDFGKITASQIDPEGLQAAIKSVHVQQNHFVFRQRKLHSVYVVVRLNFAEKIVLTRKLQRDVAAGAGAKVKTNVGGDAGISIDDLEQGALTRNDKSVISFDCARLAINADNSLTLTDWGVERLGADLNETDSAGLFDLSQPFEVIRSNPEVQKALLAWVQSAPSEDTIMLVEELVDLTCTAPEKALGRLMPISWLIQCYKQESFTESTEGLLRTLGYTVSVPKDEEPEFAWTRPTDEQEKLYTACLNIVSLAEDLSPSQQEAIGLVDKAKAQTFIDLFNAAAESPVPPRSAGAKTGTVWVSFEHKDIPKLSKDPDVYPVLSQLGIHLAIDSTTSGIYDAGAMSSSTLKNMAALLYALCTSLT